MDEPCLASKEGMDEPCLASKEGLDEPCLVSKEGMDEPCLASKDGMDEPCLASQNTAMREAGGDMDAPRSCERAISLGVINANSCMRLSSPITLPLVQDRKAGTRGKGRCLGGLQSDVDYREVLNYCSVAPLSPIAEQGGATPTYDTTPVEPLATPASPVLSLQRRTHILSIGGEGPEPP